MINSILAYQGRNGDWIQTYTGKAFWPFDPKPEEVCIEDIAHALSLLCRYGGHCKRFYSVAEHSIYVSRLCSHENALWGLLHDATEAYLVDLPRPIKWHLPNYKSIEQSISTVIAYRFGLSEQMPNEVKQIDDAILVCERDQIMSKPPFDWQIKANNIKIDVKIACLQPLEVEHLFLSEFERLSMVRLF